MRQIPREQVLRRVQAENPWWEPPNRVPAPFSTWRSRAYLGLLLPLVRDLEVRRAVVLMGPRRVGKTVLLHQSVDGLLKGGVEPLEIAYFSVDHPIYNGLGLEDLLAVWKEATSVDYQTTPCFVFFDEIQYLRDWEIHLKALVDGYPHLRCVVSGSAAAALRLKSHESGAGRFTEFLLPPLTFHEYLDLRQELELVDFGDGSALTYDSADLAELNERFLHYLNFGGYPEVGLSPAVQADPSRYVKADIIDKVLLRDLPSLYGVQDVQELNYLFTTLAFNTADEVSLEELSQGSGVAKPTIKRYIEYLEAAFLVRVVHRIDRSAKRFRRATFFKVYLANPSMRTALFSSVAQGDPVMGALVETALFSQLFHAKVQVHYARWKTGEVDIVTLGPNQKAEGAVEAKWSDRFFDRPHELSSLVKFCHSNALQQATVTTRSAYGTKTIKSVAIRFVPASVYCLAVGYSIVRGLGVDGLNPGVRLVQESA